MRELLVEYGINLQALIGGSAGGIVFSLVVGLRQPGEVAIAWVIGALTANYMAPVLGAYLNLEQFPATVAFGVGGCAKVIVQLILDKAKTWAPGVFETKPKGGGNAP